MTCTGCEERRKLMADAYEAQRNGNYQRRNAIIRQVMGSAADDVKAARDAIINKFRRSAK